MGFVVLYDSNVLYPSVVRDLLIRIAQAGLMRAKWSERVLDETFEAIRRTWNRPDKAGENARSDVRGAARLHGDRVRAADRRRDPAGS